MSASIPDDWIKEYVDQLLAVALQLPPGRLRDACLMRAEHVMDMVKAWRNHR